MATIVVYTSASCPYCVRAKMLLDQKNVVYEEIRVDLDDQKREEMVERSGRKSVPEIFINDKLIGGFDDLWALEQQGLLDELLSSN